MKSNAIVSASLALALTASPALAQTADAPSASFDVRGIDLATPQGQQMLDQRIEMLARSVCSSHASRTGTRIRSSQYRNCLANARASAKKQVATIVEQQQRGG